MPPEIVAHERAVVELDGGDACGRQVDQLARLTAAVVEMPHIDQQARIRCTGTAEQVDRYSRVGDRRPRERLQGAEPPALSQPLGVGAQRLSRAITCVLAVQQRVAAELACTDVTTPERV